MINISNQFKTWLIAVFFISLPFERLLTFDVGAYTIKPSYIVGSLLLATTFLLIAQKKIPATLYRDELALLGISLLSFLTIIWSYDKPRSLLISLVIIFAFLIFYALRRLISLELRDKIVDLIIWLSLLLSIFAIFQFFIDKTSLSYLSFLRPEYSSGVFYFARVQSTFLEPLFFANFLLIPIFFCLYRMGDKARLGQYLILLIISLAFFLTLSRGAFIALAISALFVGLVRMFYQRNKIDNYLKQIFIIICSFGLAVLCVFGVAGKNGVFQYFGHSFFSDTAAQGSVEERQNTITVAAEESLRHPFGIGSGAFGALAQYKEDIPKKGYQTVNNLYLEITVELGFLGMILFLLFIWNYALSLVQNFDKNKIWTIISMGLFLAFLTQYLFFSTIYIIYIWAVLAILSPRWQQNHKSQAPNHK